MIIIVTTVTPITTVTIFHFHSAEVIGALTGDVILLTAVETAVVGAVAADVAGLAAIVAPAVVVRTRVLVGRATRATYQEAAQARVPERERQAPGGSLPRLGEPHLHVPQLPARGTARGVAAAAAATTTTTTTTRHPVSSSPPRPTAPHGRRLLRSTRVAAPPRQRIHRILRHKRDTRANVAQCGGGGGGETKEARVVPVHSTGRSHRALRRRRRRS